MVLAAALWASGRRQARRAAWRSLGSMAAASTAANVIGKGLTGRRRPYADVPVRSRLRRVPRSSSFPSGHAANAAAFAIGAAIEMPSLAGPGIALASAVGASRVATGVHYPSDVLAGTAIGAAAGLATLRWWPRRPARPAIAIRPPRKAPASAAGEGLALIVNTSAGTAPARLAARLAALRDGEAVQVDLGLMGDRPFVNTSSTDTGTLGRSRVYRSWRASSVDVRAADGQPIWLSTDGEVATAESGFVHGKHPHALVVYRKADG